MTAPFMTVGLRLSLCMIQAIIPVTVDLPLVPATPMRQEAALNIAALSSARVMRVQPNTRARATSGTVSSIAAEATKI